MKSRGKITLKLGIVFVFCVVIFISGLLFGSSSLSVKEVLLGLIGKEGYETETLIIRTVRLPRAIGGLICGSALGVGGLILQCVSGNDLAAPNIIGVNSGAGFAVMLSMSYFPSLYFLQNTLAFFGALLTTLLVLGISTRGRGNTSKVALVLSGVAVSSLLGAGISFLSLLYPDALVSYSSFSVGGFSSVFMEDIQFPSVFIAVSLICAFLISPKLNYLSLGDEMAQSVGVNVKLIRILAIIIASALCASAVSVVGLLGFVGLIVPHIARKIFGNDHRVLVFGVAMLASILVILSDILARVAFAPGEIPCGIFLSAVGAPFFLYLLLSKKEHNCEV